MVFIDTTLKEVRKFVELVALGERSGLAQAELLCEIKAEWTRRREEYVARRLRTLAELAVRESEYWREVFATSGLFPSDIQSTRDLEALPVLKREDLQSNWKRMVIKRNISTSYTASTSGSTGIPLQLRMSNRAYGLAMATLNNQLRSVGASPQGSAGVVWGGRRASYIGRIRARITDAVLGRVRLYGYELTRFRIDHFLRSCAASRCTYLIGYASALGEIAAHVLSYPRLRWQPRALVPTGEVLQPHTKELLSQAFPQAKIIELYGGAENLSLAVGCRNGNLHISEWLHHVELLPVSEDDGCIAQVVCTPLYNEACPLFRYQNGDLVELLSEECTCGHPGRVLKRIVGRTVEMVIDMDGREHYPSILTYAAKRSWTPSAVRRWFAEQRKEGELHIFIEPGPDWTSAMAKEYIRHLNHTAPRLTCSVSIVPSLPREESGKLRYFRSYCSRKLTGELLDAKRRVL